MIKLKDLHILQNEKELKDITFYGNVFIFGIISGKYYSVFVNDINNKVYNINSTDYINFKLDKLINHILSLNDCIVITNLLEYSDIEDYLNNDKIITTDCVNFIYNNICTFSSQLSVTKDFDLFSKRIINQKIQHNTKPFIFYNKVFKHFLFMKKYYNIPINKKKFLIHYPLKNPANITHNYQLIQSTCRPTNNIDGINLLALNKNNDVRSIINARNNYVLVEYDYKAYHLQILSTLLNGDSDISSLYQIISEKYNLTYNDSKVFVFKELYSNQNKIDLDLFKKIEKLKQNLYLNYKTRYLKSLISERKFEFANSANHLFNLYMQNIESEINYLDIMSFNEFIIKNRLYNKISLILYQYDSFLFECHKDCLEKLLLSDCFKAFDFRLSIGKNYNEMQKVN